MMGSTTRNTAKKICMKRLCHSTQKIYKEIIESINREVPDLKCSFIITRPKKIQSKEYVAFYLLQLKQVANNYSQDEILATQRTLLCFDRQLYNAHTRHWSTPTQNNIIILYINRLYIPTASTIEASEFLKAILCMQERLNFFLAELAKMLLTECLNEVAWFWIEKSNGKSSHASLVKHSFCPMWVSPHPINFSITSSDLGAP